MRKLAAVVLTLILTLTLIGCVPELSSYTKLPPPTQEEVWQFQRDLEVFIPEHQRVENCKGI